MVANNSPQQISPEDYLNQLVKADNIAEIKLGLARIGAVWKKLKDEIDEIPFVYTVAGTNGKGTCCALLEQALRAHGLHTGLISSPHLMSFNERTSIDGTPANDSEWLSALEYISKIKGSTPLTYFEYCTLAAFAIFSRYQLDVWILEVGLGGRLDAVNILDADCAVITSIYLDHIEILGDTREKISSEKFAIARPNKPLVIGEPDLGDTFKSLNEAIGAKMYLIEDDFAYIAGTFAVGYIDKPNTPLTPMDTFFAKTYSNVKEYLKFTRRSIDNFSIPTVMTNLATAWQALNLYQHKHSNSRFNIDKDIITTVWKDFKLAGRWQKEKYAGLSFILDCGHNPAAAKMLANNLSLELSQLGNKPEVEAIFAMQSNKDWRGFVRQLTPIIDKWHLFTLENPKGLSGDKLTIMMQQDEEFSNLDVSVHNNAEQLMKNIHEDNQLEPSYDNEPTKIFLVCGSFHTIGEILTYINDNNGKRK